MEQRSNNKKYINSYILRYLIYQKGGCRRVSLEERKRSANEAEAKKEKGFGCHLDQKVLSLCCEHNEDDKIVRYVETGMEYLDEHGQEYGFPLPTASENFVKTLCWFFEISEDRICLSEEECRQIPTAGGAAASLWWKTKRRELRECRQKMLSGEPPIQHKKPLESQAIDILSETLKICDILHLSRIWRYLPEFLNPEAAGFWIELKECLAPLGRYTGYPLAIKLSGFNEENSSFSYLNHTEGFTPRKKVDVAILNSAAKRQGILNHVELARQTSNHRQRFNELTRVGWSDTCEKRELAQKLEELLCITWQDLYAEDTFWVEEKGGCSVWEAAENELRRASQLVNWDAKDSTGNTLSPELTLALKNIMRLTLCYQDFTRNRERLEKLAKRLSTKLINPFLSEALHQCISELAAEDNRLAKQNYMLLEAGLHTFHTGNPNLSPTRWLLRIKDEVCTNPLCHDLGLTIQVTNKNTNLNQLDDMLNLIIRLPKELREIVGYDDIPLDIKNELKKRERNDNNDQYDEYVKYECSQSREYLVIFDHIEDIEGMLDGIFSLPLSKEDFELYHEWLENVDFKLEAKQFHPYAPGFCRMKRYHLNKMLHIRANHKSM